MSNTGQAALTIVGTVVGAYFGYPQLGFALGSLAGQAAFPTDLGTVSGPRLNDNNTQVSTVGAPIPLVYGTYALSGNLIWSSGIIETVKKKRQGGKGGPTQTVKTYSYKVNCAVAICEGPITSIRRVWADAKLIYDARGQFADESDTDYNVRLLNNQAFLATATIYDGGEGQQPDPTIESYEGVTRVSAFRGLAYVVFNDFQLEDYGNRIPNFRFEVSNTTAGCVFTAQYSNEIMCPWVEAEADPRAECNGYQYWYVDVPYATFDDALAAAISITGRPLGPTVYGWEDDQFDVVYPHSGPGTSNNLRGLNLHINDTASIGGRALGSISPETTPCAVPDLFNPTTYWTGERAGGNLESGLWYVGTAREDMGVDGDGSGSFACVGPNRAYFNRDVVLRVERVPTSPGDEWTRVESTSRALANLQQTGLDDPIDHYPLNPTLPAGHSDYSNQTFWEAAYDAAVASGDLPAGWTYGVEYPVTNDFYYTKSLGSCPEEGEPITLGSIVRDLCLRAGLEDDQVDVSDLSEFVDGYAVGRPMSARDAISPLRSFGWFDCVESDGSLRWPTRGKAAVAELSESDLSAHPAGETRPSEVETTRTQEVEIPRRLRVHYAQTDMNYEPGEQSASRLTAGDVEARDIEVAVAMSHQKARQIADVVLYDMWVSRNRYRLTLDHSHLSLEPGDAITAPVDGRQERLRITSIDHALPGLLRLDCVRDDDGAYVSYGIATDPEYSGATGAIASTGTADLVLLDLPALRDEDDDAGYYAAVQAVGGTNFGGAVLFRSPDGGTNYDEVATLFEEATIGEIAQPLPPGPTTIIDEGNELLVECDEDLESISDESLLAGLNAAAIGDDGRWEIVQFRDAEQVGSPPVWRLTGLLRGRRGTEWAVGSSEAGDRFVLLDSAIARVALNLSAVGASRLHKAVLSGTSIEATDAVTFAGLGVALRPFSPAELLATRDETDDIVLTWVRRGRIGQELPSGTDIPLSEASESYEVDVMSGSTVVRTIATVTPTATYTAAQQTTDFGSPPASVTFRVYQISASVGRGYPSEVTHDDP